MRILVAGDWHSELHEEGVYRAFGKLGHEVYKFPWHQYFQIPVEEGSLTRHLHQVSNRFQNKFVLGPLIRCINSDFVNIAKDLRPDLVFVYRGTHITRRALRAIKGCLPSVVLVGYNNDDPFAAGHPFWLWRHFLESIGDYDLVLAYRPHNVADFLHAGAKCVRLLRSWFVPERNHAVPLSAEDWQRFGCDVAFVGHYEKDDRVDYLEEIVRQGFRLNLYGPGYDWDPVIAKSSWLNGLRPVGLVWGEDYNKALCGAKIALCFLSRLNRDTYTRRCFEIPATKTLLLSEYSDDLASIYAEGVEADFFRSKQELIAKLRVYMDNEELRKSVALAGYRRVIADGHDVVSRMRQLLEWGTELSQSERLVCV